MIRRGKQDGWLKSHHSGISRWAAFNGVEFSGVAVDQIDGKGLAVVANPPIEDVLIRVPQELVLSKETAHLHAKSDSHFKSLLDALGDFGRTSRGSILAFLLFQATRSCPQLDETIGVASPLTQYINFLPLEDLPVFWNSEELDLLDGTSLAPAITSKLKSLHREFLFLRSSTEEIPWCSEAWWQNSDDSITFDDWKQVDSFYRSRALEFPGIGDCMVPCIDLCNHASGAQTSALYESDTEGNAILIPRNGLVPNPSDEITITYGDEKGACEMIFSYGFLEESMDSAKSVFLDLDIPESDPLRPAKQAIALSAPGVRLIHEAPDMLRWISDYVWLVCVNEEDGLSIDVLQTNDGQRELRVTWKNENLSDLALIERSLQRDPLWKVYELRAIVTLQNRIEQQLRTIYDNQEMVDERSRGPNIRARPRILASKLRELEAELLEQFHEFFEQEVRERNVAEKCRLIEATEVREYLNRNAVVDYHDQGADFS